MLSVPDVGIFLIVTVTLATALEPFVSFKEGSCSEMPLQPVNASKAFLETMSYLSAGNKYNMYQIATQLPSYRSMSEDEFYYDACYTRNTTTKTTGDMVTSVFGFGRPLFRLHVTSKPGIFLENIPTDPLDSWDTAQELVTLTDNKSFAFLVYCWTGVEERAWALVTLTPDIDSTVRMLIEDHAESLGFKKENFVFLRYDSCRWDDPIFEDRGWRSNGERTPPVTQQSD